MSLRERLAGEPCDYITQTKQTAQHQQQQQQHQQHQRKTSILRSETGGAEEQTYSFMQTGDVSLSESIRVYIICLTLGGGLQ